MDRSKADAAASKYLGIVEAETLKFRNFLIQSWNQNPDLSDLSFAAYSLQLEIQLAFTDFELTKE